MLTGVHVLVGVKNVVEARSFSYESRKGLETILLDVTDPTSMVKLVYRLQEIQRDLQKDLLAVVINNMGTAGANQSTSSLILVL